jgi:drug/metabolite transporter (DMT)-like permease
VNINKGITYMLISALISAFSAVFIKILLVEIHLVELAFFRNLFGVIIILYFIYKNPIKSKRGKPFLLIARGILGALGMFTYFYSISTLPLGVAITLNKTSPIFGAIFAFLFLSEKLTKGNIVAMMIGFFGIILISKPMGFIIEFNMFIGQGIKLVPVTVESLSKISSTLEFFMGKNTPARREFIEQNLITDIG